MRDSRSPIDDLGLARALPYGWRDFDTEVVAGLVKNDPAYLLMQPDAGMICPLLSHERESLHWQDGNYAKGTMPHGEPAVVFRVTPTYILTERRDNIIVGANLIERIMDGTAGKAETKRLGHENSEDALTWNVFRSLQEAGLLHLLTPLICDCNVPVEPILYLWGNRIDDGEIRPFEQLEAARQAFEPTHRQQTEPDVVLRVPGWGWVFIEAKFGSSITTSQSADKMETWLRRYADKARHIIDLNKIAGADLQPKRFPEQLLRNALFASWVADRTEERAHVVLLARRQEITPIDEWLSHCLKDDAPVTFSRLTWEEIRNAVPEQDASLVTLRSYMEGKSYSLRRAFDFELS